MWSLFKVLSVELEILILCLDSTRPLIFGSRFDVSNDCFFPFLTDLLIKSHGTTLGRLIDITGPELSNTKAMAEKLSLKVNTSNKLNY